MKLSDFDHSIDDVILKRGEDYFNRGHVHNISEIEKNHYMAEIIGSDFYFVKIVLDDHEEIIETICDCPYDWSDICKHQVAAFFALRKMRNSELDTSKRNNKPAVVKKTDLKTILTKMTKEELITIILDSTKEYPEIEKQLLFQAAPAKDEVSTSKKLIREYINKSKKHGFIEWRNVNYAVQGAELTLEKARKRLESGNEENAVLLSIAVLSIIVDMLQYCDDSSGIVGDVISESLSIIDEAVLSCIDSLNEKEQAKLFTVIMKEALNVRYEGWSDWRFSLLRTCIHLAGNPNIRLKLEGQLESMLVSGSEHSWSIRYDHENIKLLQLEIIEMFDEEGKKEQFIKENIHYSSFREKSINSLFEKGKYQEVITLCQEGEEGDKDYRGLISQWKEYRFQAYEKLGDIKKQRELALDFVYKNEHSYFYKLKKLFDREAWKKVLHSIVETFEQQSRPPSIFIEILIHEDLNSNLLVYCKKYISSVEELYPYLIEDYFEEVNGLFITYIEKEAQIASDRRKYKAVCKIIKTYNKACGMEHAENLISKLKQLFAKRPAFVDELGKIK